MPIYIFLSILPGLINALSNKSIRFVAPITNIPLDSLKPSNSTNNWFNVESFSELDDDESTDDLFLPNASISSIKIIQGLFSLANLNNSLILFAPTPTYVSWNCEPDVAIIPKSISPLNAFVIKVLPFPGGPSKIIPFGTLTLNLEYLV